MTTIPIIWHSKMEFMHTSVQLLHPHPMPWVTSPGTKSATSWPSTHHGVICSWRCSRPHLVLLLSLLLLHKVLVETLGACTPSEVLPAQCLVLLGVLRVSHLGVPHGDWVPHDLWVPILVLP